MRVRFDSIEKWAHRLLALPAAWLVFGLYLAATSLAAGTLQAWSWLSRWRHLPEGGVVATVVKEGNER